MRSRCKGFPERLTVDQRCGICKHFRETFLVFLWQGFSRGVNHEPLPIEEQFSELTQRETDGGSLFFRDGPAPL